MAKQWHTHWDRAVMHGVLVATNALVWCLAARADIPWQACYVLIGLGFLLSGFTFVAVLVWPIREERKTAGEDERREEQPAKPFVGVNARSVEFVGRESQLRELHRLLQERGGVTVGSALHTGAVLTGIGGIGKTELAAQYAYNHRGDYDGIFGLRAESRESLATGIVTLLPQELGIPEQVYKPLTESAQQARAVLDHVGDRRLLLIYDNVTDIRHLDGLLPNPPACTIITTRLDASTAGWERLEVDLLPLDDAVDLLRALLGDDCVAPQEEAARGLCETLVGHPLALELAAGWLEWRGQKDDIAGLVAELRQRLTAHPALATIKDDRAAQAAWGLEECFEASWRELTAEAEAVAALAGLFAPWDIPERLLLEAAARPESGLSPEQADGGLAMCVQLSLLKRSETDQGRLNMHPLIHDFAGRKAKEGERALREAFVRTFIRFAQQEVDVTRWREVQPDVPHLARAAELAPDCIEDEDVTWPHTGLGRFYEHTGAYDLARGWYERAVAVADGRFGTEHPKYATCLHNLAGVLWAQGDLAGARERAERALSIDMAAYGPDHPAVATGLNNLASVLQDLGDLAGARERYERALGIMEGALGSDHPRVATCLNNLAEVLRAQGDLAGASKRAERALGITERALGPAHPDTAIRLNNLASVLYDQGDLPGAQARFERALEITEKAKGPHHPDVAACLGNLAGVLQALGDLTGARERTERALEMRRRALGEEHPDYAQSLGNLAGILLDQGDLAGARERAERALAIFEARLPPDHPDIRTVRGNLEAIERRLKSEGAL